LNKDKKEQTRRPEWTPESGGREYASKVMDGIKSVHDGFNYGNEENKRTKKKIPTRKTLQIDDYVNGVLNSDRTLLARAITLIESNSRKHFTLAQEVLNRLIKNSGNSLRIGITGMPGAGKSTFIESFGNFLCDMGKKVAVLAIDPSSTITKGSILGDKTRMESLSRRKEAFIRPSPSGGVLGGVARKSRETMMLVEAAGYDVILIETVGVGQSETVVRSMTDFFLLLTITGAGDELQGMKKGIMELSDAILINKADGDNLLKARTTQAEYNRILHYLQNATEGWETTALTCSSIKNEGIGEIWKLISEFEKKTKESGVFYKRRKSQKREWVYSMLTEYIKDAFFNDDDVKNAIPEVERELFEGKITSTQAASKLIDLYNYNS